MAGNLAWTHLDTTADLHRAGLEAYNHARTGAPWDDSPEGNRLFRAWMASILATVANLGPTPTAPLTKFAGVPVEGMIAQGYGVFPQPAERTDNYDWQIALTMSLAAMAWSGRALQEGRAMGADPASFVLPDGLLAIATRDGAPPVFAPPLTGPPITVPRLGDIPILTAGFDSGDDTGIIPAIPIVTGLVVIACVGILAAAVGWITSQASEVAAIGIQTKAKSTEAVAAITSASELVEAHQQREQQEGRSLPYSQGELELLETLRSTIKQLSGWEAPPLRSVPDVRGLPSKGLTTIELVSLVAIGYGILKYSSQQRHA